MLNLKLDVDKAFLNDVLVDRVATVKLAKTHAEVAPSSTVTGIAAQTALSAVGTFNVFNAGSSKNCAITAEAIMPDQGVKYWNGPSDIEATLTATVVRRVHFAKGTLEVVTDIPWAKINGGVDPADHVHGATGVNAGGLLKLTRSDATTDAVIEVTIDTVTVATGIGEDPNCNGVFYAKSGLGHVHIDAVCEWARIAGLKPNPEHFNVRALDPHTFAFTLTIPEAMVLPTT